MENIIPTIRYEKEITWGQAAITVVIIVLILAYSAYTWWNQLSKEELEEYNDIMQYFYDDPNFKDFMKIYNARKQLIRHSGRPIKFWLWGVYLTQPQFYNDARKEEITPWLREIERAIRRVWTQPTSELLDCIWSLYFATGDQQYPEIIRRIAAESTNVTVRNAARWSYRSIMKHSYNDPEPPTQPAPEQMPEQMPEQLSEQLSEQLPEQPVPEQPLPEQPLPEQPLPEQPMPEQPLPEQLPDDAVVNLVTLTQSTTPLLDNYNGTG